VTAIHRFGTIAPGEQIVLVVTASAHRGAAFAAAEMLMDYLKTRAPFWKRARRDRRLDRRTGSRRKAADDARRRVGTSRKRRPPRYARETTAVDQQHDDSAEHRKRMLQRLKPSRPPTPSLSPMKPPTTAPTMPMTMSIRMPDPVLLTSLLAMKPAIRPRMIQR
jgi:hypothetical protein